MILETVNGIGYKIYGSRAFLGNISKQDANLTKVRPSENSEGRTFGSGVKIWTHLYQREDTIELYGFKNYAELEFFETLIKVPGIGPKSALGVFDVASVDVLKNAIASGKTEHLTRVSGIGRKTAEKIVLELKEKFGGKEGAIFQFQEDEEVFEALKSIGYSIKDIREALNEIPKEINGTQKRLKEALKILGR